MKPSVTIEQEAATRMLELRQGNMLPDGVTIQDLIREGRDLETEEARGAAQPRTGTA